MGQGKKKVDPPAHGNHMRHFDEAMENALENTNPSDGAQSVTFQVVVSPNPGGVKEYIVNIGGG
jgi:hypothetical protein